jgi:hypothetical protein
MYSFPSIVDCLRLSCNVDVLQVFGGIFGHGLYEQYQGLTMSFGKFLYFPVNFPGFPQPCSLYVGINGSLLCVKLYGIGLQNDNYG